MQMVQGSEDLGPYCLVTDLTLIRIKDQWPAYSCSLSGRYFEVGIGFNIAGHIAGNIVHNIAE